MSHKPALRCCLVTVLMTSHGTLTINPALYKNIEYDSLKDLAPVTGLIKFANILVINPSVPVTSVKESRAERIRTRAQ